jgi:hypothetical protein
MLRSARYAEINSSSDAKVRKIEIRNLLLFILSNLQFHPASLSSQAQAHHLATTALLHGHFSLLPEIFARRSLALPTA